MRNTCKNEGGYASCYLYIYIYIHIYTHIYVYVLNCAYVHIYTHIHTCMHLHTYIYIIPCEKYKRDTCVLKETYKTDLYTCKETCHKHTNNNHTMRNVYECSWLRIVISNSSYETLLGSLLGLSDMIILLLCVCICTYIYINICVCIYKYIYIDIYIAVGSALLVIRYDQNFVYVCLCVFMCM